MQVPEEQALRFPMLAVILPKIVLRNPLTDEHISQ
jgi:hypothetical protein